MAFVKAEPDGWLDQHRQGKHNCIAVSDLTNVQKMQ
jgi:hypothetical protein